MAKEIDLGGVTYLVGIKYVNNPFTGLLDAIETISKKPLYVSHFNTTDGTNNALVGNTSVTNRSVANPGSYDIGDWTAGTAHGTLRGNFSVSTANGCSFIDDTTTTFTVKVFGADGTTVLLEETTDAITGNGTYALTNASISVSGWDTNDSKYIGSVSTTINISDIISDGGRFSYTITHNDGDDGTFTKTQSDIFYDNEVNTAAMTGVSIAESTPSIKQISGVNYYDGGSTFEVNIGDIDNLNGISYPGTQVSLEGSQFGLPPLSLSGSDLTGWTNDYNDIDDTYQKTDWEITGSLCTVGNKTVSGHTIDWSNGATQTSNGLDVAINTITDNATRIYDDFRGEDRRLESDFTTAWDSTRDLVNGELQVGCSYLFYPTLDYTSILPDTSTQPDYSGITGDGYYYRTMESDGTDKSNGIFSLIGITEDNITNDDIIFELSYNGTDFYNMNEDYAGGALSDGQGCRVEPDVYNLTDNGQIKFTFGTGGSGSKVYIKIKIPQGSLVKLNSINLTDWA